MGKNCAKSRADLDVTMVSEFTMMVHSISWNGERLHSPVLYLSFSSVKAFNCV